MRRAVTDADRAWMKSLQDGGKSQEQIASITGRSRSVVRYHLNEQRRALEQARLKSAMRLRQDVEENRPRPERTGEFAIGERYTVPVKQPEQSGAVYFLWDKHNRCIYIGQSTHIHPLFRIIQHKDKEWWSDIDRIEYVEVYGDLDLAERTFIQEIRPLKNIAHNRD